MEVHLLKITKPKEKRHDSPNGLTRREEDALDRLKKAESRAEVMEIIREYGGAPVAPFREEISRPLPSLLD